MDKPDVETQTKLDLMQLEYETRRTDPDLVTAKERIQQWADYQQQVGPLDEVRLLHHG